MGVIIDYNMLKRDTIYFKTKQYLVVRNADIACCILQDGVTLIAISGILIKLHNSLRLKFICVTLLLANILNSR